MIVDDVQTRQAEVSSSCVGPVRKLKCSNRKIRTSDKSQRPDTSDNHATNGSVKVNMSRQEFNTYMTNWLRDNFIYPYPDHDGIDEMARTSGRTRTTILNWLNNNRSRKWYNSMEKVFKLNRPSDSFYEDCLNMFDGKPLRNLSTTLLPMAEKSGRTKINIDNDASKVKKNAVFNDKVDETPPSSIELLQNLIVWSTEQMNDLDALLPELTEYREEREEDNNNFICDDSSSGSSTSTCRLSLPKFNMSAISVDNENDSILYGDNDDSTTVSSRTASSTYSFASYECTTIRNKKRKRDNNSRTKPCMDAFFTSSSKLDDFVLLEHDFDDGNLFDTVAAFANHVAV